MIRPVVTDDVPFVVECLRDMRGEFEFSAERPDDPEYVSKMLLTLIDTEVFYGFIEDGRGFILATDQPTWYDPRVMTHEQLLYVCPQWRGSTTAYRLVLALKVKAIENGSTEIHAGSVIGHKVPQLIALYKRAGFEEHTGGVRYRIT